MPASDLAVARYRRRLAVYRAAAAAAAIAAWEGLDSYEEDDVATFAAATAAALAGAKAATVATSAAFYALALGTRPVGVRPADVAVDAQVAQPFLATWHALKVGRPFAEAVIAGRSQAEAVGFDLVQSTARRTGDRVAEASGRTVRWRRVPGPGACDWCQTVAGQLYRTAESADFGHARCDCAAVPA